MGQPIRIVDLAGHMITMAGLVPGVDVRIEFTGLRPGEKLNEMLLTGEEEESRVVRSGVSVASSPEPPPDLEERLENLRRCADRPDRERLLETLRDLVPSFRAPQRSDERALRPGSDVN
jgi:FlaA1/EpsC-like NDP-sugar epimerase